MSNDFVQVYPDQAGKKVQTILNTVGSNNVEAECVALIDSAGNLLGTTPASTAAGATQEGLVVSLSPNSPLPAGSAALGSVTVTSNVLPTGAATAANQTNGSQTTKVTDGTNTAAVKAASTAAAATDPSLVVGLSPNSPLPAGTNVLGSLAANQSVNLAQVAGTNTLTGGAAGSVGIGGLAQSSFAAVGNPVLIAGASSGTVRTISTDGSGQVYVNQGAAASAANAWTAKVTDGTNTAAVKAASTAAAATDPSLVVGLSPNSPLPAGTNVLGVTGVAQASTTSGQNGELVQGAVTTANPSYTTAQTSPVSLSTFGNVRVQNAPVDGVKATYCAVTKNLSPAASATDIFVITGSASKTVRITRLVVSATQTTASQVYLGLDLGSTADTGGTSAAVNATKLNSSNPAASATVASYSANPTKGSSSTIWASTIFVPALSTTSYAAPTEIRFGGPSPEQAVVLQGTAQQLAVNLNGSTVTGGSYDIAVYWTEE
jgi:hypothetical protein